MKDTKGKRAKPAETEEKTINIISVEKLDASKAEIM